MPFNAMPSKLRQYMRRGTQLREVAEPWRPTLLKGVLANGDFEWVSIFIDHLAVVALDRPDLQQVPVAGQTPPGGVVLGESEDLIPPGWSRLFFLVA